MSLDTTQEELDQLARALASVDMGRINDLKGVFDDIMAPYPTILGKAASKKEREEMKLKKQTLTYGEISFDSFAIVMDKIKRVYGKPEVGHSGFSGILQQQGGIFYDLGSGVGKPVIAAAICHEFDSCTGIEILEGLFSLSLDVMAVYNSKGKSKLARDHETNCQFLFGDFLNLEFKDWRDGDVVFANSTCYDDELMAKIGDIALGMKRGSFFISLTKRLPVADFEVLEHEMYRMSWGEATVYIMQKTTDPKERPPTGARDSDDEEA